jgi:hypothetical protein
MFKVSPASFQAFIDTPNCVLVHRVQYSTAHIPNVLVFCDGHLQITNCVFFYSNHQVQRDLLITLCKHEFIQCASNFAICIQRKDQTHPLDDMAQYICNNLLGVIYGQRLASSFTLFLMARIFEASWALVQTARVLVNTSDINNVAAHRTAMLWF